MTSLWKRQSRSERDASYRRIAYQPNIGDYELLSPIGGVDDMSYLFLAIHKPTRTSVALKYTDLSISPDMAFIDELNTVVNNTMKYQHSSLLPYFQSFIENDRLWTVTLPMKAGSLRSVLEEYFPNGMSETAVVTVLKYLLRALDYLHDQGVIHNDVRADNLLLDFSGDVRLVGLHQISNLAEARPSAFDYVGMPAWMSPELFEQQVSFDPRSDIYSLGITAIELACGKTPYHEWPSLKIMVAKLKYLPPISEAEINKGKKRPYSKHFFSFVRSCLERDPASRPHAHELLQHPLMKRAKGASYLVSRLVKRTNLRHKYSRSPQPNTPALPTSRPSSPSAAGMGHLTTNFSQELLHDTSSMPGGGGGGTTTATSVATSACASVMSSSTALHVPGGSRPMSPASLLTASSSISNVSGPTSLDESRHESQLSFLSDEPGVSSSASGSFGMTTTNNHRAVRGGPLVVEEVEDEESGGWR